MEEHMFIWVAKCNGNKPQKETIPTFALLSNPGNKSLIDEDVGRPVEITLLLSPLIYIW